MPSLPVLTIAIPTLNRAYCLTRCLESALAQTVNDIEIIISDNGSNDETPLIIDRYNDPRLRKFRRSKTISASEHGNFLLEQSRGRFFIGLSDDDYLEPHFVEKVLGLFEKHPNLSFVYTGCWIHYKNIAVPAIVGPEIEDGADFVYAFYKNTRNVCWCACVTRVEQLKKIGAIPEGTIFGDMFYWTKIAFWGPVGCVNELLSNYVFMSDNISSSVPVPIWSKEAESLAMETYERYCMRTQSLAKKKCLRLNIRRFLAVSTGNQFVWNALYGISRQQLIFWAPKMIRYLTNAPGTLMQIFAAIFLPNELLYRIILSRASRLRKHRLQ